MNSFSFWGSFNAYCLDALQRQGLFLDTLRQRGDETLCNLTKPPPELLAFETTPLLDGMSLTPAVAYTLVRVIAPPEAPTDPAKRPVIIFDPRSAQGPGMAGLNKQSQIGLALDHRHPTYYVTFSAQPAHGQTMEGICEAEATFIRWVRDHHRNSAPPLLIGNCQAGWQLAITQAAYTDQPCPMVLTAAPLSYWAGKHNENPVRYTSGVAGGSWSTALACDLGGGVFDSIMLTDNFEKNNPEHSLLQKYYKLYACIDTESDRFLAFERWWNSTVLFQPEEMMFIVEKLFIENSFVNGTLTIKDHANNQRPAHLCNITAPLFLYCGTKDVITPPAQALGWLLHAYKDEADVIAQKKTIIYTIDPQAGHLGLIVSRQALKNIYHRVLASTDAMERLPSGLYEAVPDPASPDGFLFERRGFDALRSLCDENADDDARFHCVKLVSQTLSAAYRSFAAPVLQNLVSRELGSALRMIHPIRLRLLSLSALNPLCTVLPMWAAWASAFRTPVETDNIFWQAQEAIVTTTAALLNNANGQKNDAIDFYFSALYSATVLQNFVATTKTLSSEAPHEAAPTWLRKP